MKINVQEILEKQFDKKMSGYNPEQVDDFLDQLIDQCTAANKERDEMAARIADLEGKLKRAVEQLRAAQAVPSAQAAAPAQPAAAAAPQPSLQDQEAGAAQVLLGAQRLAEKIKNMAEREAQEIRKSANTDRMKALGEIDEDIRRSNARLAAVNAKTRVVRERLKELLSQELERVSAEIEEDA